MAGVGLALIVVSLLHACEAPQEPGMPTIALAPSSVRFAGVELGANPPGQSLAIANSGGGLLAWTAEVDVSWLDLERDSGEGPATIALRTNTSGLSFGTHNATISVRSPRASNTPQRATVVLELTQAPEIVLSPTQIAFAGIEHGANPESQTLEITNAGGGSMNWTAVTNASWLTVSPAAGSGDATLVLSATIDSLGQGGYEGTIGISAPGARNTPQSVRVTLRVEPQGNYSVGIAPNIVRLSPGGSAAATVTVTRIDGFSGAVGLTVAGLPGGVTGVFSPATVTATQSTLALAATQDAAVGTTQLIVSGNTPGLDTKTASLHLEVQQSTIFAVEHVGDLPVSGIPTAIALDESRGEVFVALSNGKIEVFDEETHQLVTSFDGCLDGIHSTAFVLDTTYRKIYAGCGWWNNSLFERVLRVIDANSGSLLKTFNISTRGVPLWRFAFDEWRHRLYVSCNCDDTEVAVIDVATDILTPISEIGARLYGAITYDETSNKVYVMRQVQKELAEIDGSTLATRVVPLPSYTLPLTSMGLLKSQNKLYLKLFWTPLAPFHSAAICVIRTLELDDGCAVLLTDSDWGGIVASESLGKVYVGNEVGSVIGIIDGMTDVMRQIPYAGGTGTSNVGAPLIEVNPETGHVFFVKIGTGGGLVVMDGTSGEMRTLSYSQYQMAPSGDWDIAISRTTQKVYVANRDLAEKVAVFQDRQ